MAFNWNLKVPYKYGNQYVTLAHLEEIMLRDYHPEYVRRFIGWLHYKNGNVGAGGLSRTEQPNKPGSAPSLLTTFHWAGQTYNDGVTAACAVDTVFRDGPDAGDAHDGIAWTEVPIQGTPEAVKWGIHANVGVPGDGESWHIQPIEIDGHASWVKAGRPAPKRGYPIPAEHDPYGSTTTPPPSGGSIMTVNTWWSDPPQRVASAVAINAGQTVGVNLGQKPAAVTVALTVDGEAPGFLTVWSGKQARPEVASLTFSADPNVTSQVDTLVNTDGFFQIYAHAACKVWVDLIATHS